MDIELQASRQWLIFVVLVHLGALSCTVVSGAPIWLKIVVGLVCVYSAVANSWETALRKVPRAITRCWVSSEGQWALQNRAGQVVTARLCADSLVTRFLIVLNFKPLQTKRVISIILVPDVVDTPTFQRLKLYLHTQKSGFL